MIKVKTYAVNCSDAWLNTDGDDISESYVKYADYMVLATKLELAERACSALAEENAGMKDYLAPIGLKVEGTPATDAFLDEVKAESRKEGAYFVSNRMLAAWIAGFIDDTAKNAADIARMIITSTEFMDDAPDGDFDRSFSDSVLEDIINQLRKGVDQK